MIYITGDTHGQFRRIKQFCDEKKTTKEDILIILGDVALNYNGNHNDLDRKRYVRNLPITVFCVHGNHESRPATVSDYYLVTWHGGKVWINNEFPNQLFAKDGEVYDIGGQKTIVIGGAYSVDKDYRLMHGYPWFSDEQPSEEIKRDVEKKLDEMDWKVDVVLSHTTPLRYEPVDMFLAGLDQSTVDDSTERWLEEIEQKLEYQRWFAGHFHTDRQVDKLRLMFQDIDTFLPQA